MELPIRSIGIRELPPSAEGEPEGYSGGAAQRPVAPYGEAGRRAWNGPWSDNCPRPWTVMTRAAMAGISMNDGAPRVGEHRAAVAVISPQITLGVDLASFWRVSSMVGDVAAGVACLGARRGDYPDNC